MAPTGGPTLNPLEPAVTAPVNQGFEARASGRATNDLQIGLHRTLLLQAARLEGVIAGPRAGLFLRRDNHGDCKPPVTEPRQGRSKNQSKTNRYPLG
jgi:hypothetical protein